MVSKKNIFQKKSVAKLALSLSALLMISACSDNATTDDVAPVDEVETTVVEEPAVVEPVEDTAAATEEPLEPEEVAAIVDADTDTAAEPEILAANAGEELYNKQCVACHVTGLLNAPKFGDKEAWAPRIAKGKETLYMHSAQGFNKMPPQASDEVSVAQVHAAVDYMVAAAS